MANKTIIVCFDGTGNDPGDAAESSGFSLFNNEDRSISNVLKLHLLAGGPLNNANSVATNGQLSLYYMGVGNNYTSPVFGDALNALAKVVAVHEPDKIMQMATNDLATHYLPGDRVYLIGFSRGAAIARKFAQKINDTGLDTAGSHKAMPIEFLGCFDTVSALDGKLSTDPARLDERNGKIAACIKRAVHLLAIDETRKSFAPTLMGVEPRVTEVWFRGVHSDVGGGYDFDRLSDLCLSFMQEQINKEATHPVVFKNASELDYQQLGQYGLQEKHLAANGSANGHLHSNSESWRMRLKDLSNRLEPRKITTAAGTSGPPPLLHYSVFERNQPNDPPTPELGDRSKYRIIEKDGSISPAGL